MDPNRQRALVDAIDTVLRLCSSEETRHRDAHRLLDCSPVYPFDQLRRRSSALTWQSCAPTLHDGALRRHRQIDLRSRRTHLRKKLARLRKESALLRNEPLPLRPDLVLTRQRLTHERKLGAPLWKKVRVYVARRRLCENMSRFCGWSERAISR